MAQMERNITSRPLLILDLDETLIYGAEQELDRPSDFCVGQFLIYKRPHLDTFLYAVHALFDLAIWSSASHDYVTGIASRLGKKHGIDWLFVWSRNNCIKRMDMELFETNYLKDLKKTKRFGYPKERILIVDDTRKKVSRNYGNAIYPIPFEGDSNDDELKHLKNYLVRISSQSNFRKIEKRRWRSEV